MIISLNSKKAPEKIGDIQNKRKSQTQGKSPAVSRMHQYTLILEAKQGWTWLSLG